MTLDMPTPETLEAEADDLERRAEQKERTANARWCSPGARKGLMADVAIFREEAQAKRAKAERLRKAAAAPSCVWHRDCAAANDAAARLGYEAEHK